MRTFERARAHKYYKFLVYLAVVILLNAAGATLFFRLDLTANKTYSLSAASREAVATLSEPLTVKVFFTDHLPAPYNDTERYVHDLLDEYAVAGNSYFNYQFYNVSTEDNKKASENRDLAQSFGIYPVQIQNIEQDEVKFQKAYMGMALIHGNIVKTIPTITSTEGLEYRITSDIQEMNNKISALLDLKHKVSVRLILSSSLEAVGPYLNLPGLAQLQGRIKDMVEKLNAKSYGKLAFSAVDPSSDAAAGQEAQKAGVLSLRWEAFRDRRGRLIQADHGYAGILVAYGGKTEKISLIKPVTLPLFGTQYELADMGKLRQSIDDAVENVIDVNEEIGYLAGHGTLLLRATMEGAATEEKPLSHFRKLLSGEYTVREVNLKDGIPAELPTLIIAGPKEKFSDYDLYQLDQYLMKGRNLAIFLDSFHAVEPPPQYRMMGQGPSYVPVDTGIGKLLSHYGLSVGKSYVLDKNCYTQRIPETLGGGQRKIYVAPIVKDEFINKGVPFLRNIKGLVMLNASPVEVDRETIKDDGLKAIKLFSSSRKAWELSGRINPNSMFSRPPLDKSRYGQMPLAYIIQGEFPSYFKGRGPVPKPAPAKGNGNSAKGSTVKKGDADLSHFKSEGATIDRGKPGKIFLIGSSEVLKNDIVDSNGSTPNAQFIMNVIDYLNGRESYALMRSKSQSFNPLMDTTASARTFIKSVNIAGLPLLVILAGLFVWFRRERRKRLIQRIFGEKH